MIIIPPEGQDPVNGVTVKALGDQLGRLNVPYDFTGPNSLRYEPRGWATEVEIDPSTLAVRARTDITGFVPGTSLETRHAITVAGYESLANPERQIVAPGGIFPRNQGMDFQAEAYLAPPDSHQVMEAVDAMARRTEQFAQAVWKEAVRLKQPMRTSLGDDGFLM